jgi:Tfp pilus assembly protein PilX/uncharacterized protein YegL
MADTYKSWHASHRPAIRRQAGMASIIVTMITMVVISLIVLGFATLSRRDQRETLDQQLSAQAFYAAESGVEDARKVIQSALRDGRPLVNKEECLTNNPGGNYPTGVGTVLDDFNEVSYTCLKVDASPQAAKYDGVGDDYVVIPIKTNQPISRLEITWQPVSQPAGTPASCPATTSNVFSPQTSWPCGYGILRSDIIATAGGLTTAGLQSGMLTGYFVPTKVGAVGQLSYQDDRAKPNILAGDCDTVAYTVCKATVTNLGANTEFMLRISSLYHASNIAATAYQGSNALSIDGAQAVIDATGRAHDVLRRVQVRLPISAGSHGSAPAYAMYSNSSICKRFQVSRTYLNIPADIVNKDNSNPMCVQLSNGVPPAKQCVQTNDIALALDVSNSMSKKWQTDKAINILRADIINFATTSNISAATNHASLITYSDNSKVLYPLGNSALGLSFAAATLATEGGTNYLKGLTEADNELSGARARAGSPKVVVFVSDGAPDDDKTAIRDKAAELKAAGVAVYTIGIDGTNYQAPIQPFDEQLLMDMAGNGGRFTVANNEADLQNIMRSISNDVRCQ